ncbi:MAG TPA: 2OG-Fe(II) oxygenase, partial [Jiangellaceae bacterium]|nr:2OG-Fe(II) oxygenase [Jiangellaceae bacterium]
PGDVLTLEVTGLGPIQLPIRAAQAKQLIAAAHQAPYGQGEETLNDATVRDTWAITPDQVRLEGPVWHDELEGSLQHIADELGMPAGTRLTAELHSVLVYGKGQFFLPHQDSEKHDAMVASLVVMLPSVHTGGELVVDDAGTERVYRGSREELVLVAFYADRRHEVRPVRSGYRVTITFNLLLTGSGAAPAAGPVAEASSYLSEHFATRVTSRYGGRDLGRPTRLAFLLDHEYTEAGLAAGRLKGADAERVATLRAAAEQAGCETVLALTEVHETWDVLPTEQPWYDDWYDEDDGDDEPEHDDDDVALNSLLDDEITLGWWVSPDGSEAEKINLALNAHEVCAVTPTSSLTPYATEYEGYMGNYGNTVDRWYRRAAVVMWPKESAFAARAEAGSRWALRTLLDRIDAGDLKGARAGAASLEPFWIGVEADLLMPALRVALGLEDAVTARVVTAPFRLESLTRDHAPLLAALAKAYGDPWLMDVIGIWEAANRFAGPDRLTWVAECLLPLSEGLCEHGADAIAVGLVDRVWRRLWSRIQAELGQGHPERRRASLAELGEPLARVLEAAPDALATDIAESLRTAGDHGIELLVPTLRAHRPPPTPALVALAHECRLRLARITDRPARAEDDWSISWTGCGCDICDRLKTFLGARVERTLEWPLAKPGRQHVHLQIEAAGLPVRHTTRRQGRPYTLVLTKTMDLFRREDEAHRQAQAELAWLTSAFE